ncbi:hypothetical protein CEXT_530581 [Caerostris extrusa]|uniref:Uncharacterized protein n=1 Tax=Caerostris extrusa TaxID=172846 RepID=A0AAV4WRV2_CAEEX|nr:hypothetical protein CEXT_530581 [Caerostris extrusa]
MAENHALEVFLFSEKLSISTNQPSIKITSNKKYRVPLLLMMPRYYGDQDSSAIIGLKVARPMRLFPELKRRSCRYKRVGCRGKGVDAKGMMLKEHVLEKRKKREEDHQDAFRPYRGVIS